MKVLFVSSGNTGFQKVPFIESQEKSLIDKNIEVTHFLIFGKGLIGYLKNVPKLRKLIKENSYHVIHSHYSFCAWVVVLTFSGLPHVVSYMGSDVYGLVDKTGRKRLRGYLEITIAKLLQPFVDKIIVKSQNLKDYVYIKNKAIIVPNGVNFKLFQPREPQPIRTKLGLPLDKKVVLFLGNPNDPRKNIQLLQNAIELLNDDQIELVAPYPIAPHEIPHYINAADVLIMTSYLEGSPNVIKEAMASNCPIVATDVGDVVEVMGNTEGCYITEFDEQDLAQKITKAIAFSKPTTGRRDIEHLEIGNIAESIIRLYQGLIRNQSNGDNSNPKT